MSATYRYNEPAMRDRLPRRVQGVQNHEAGIQKWNLRGGIGRNAGGHRRIILRSLGNGNVAPEIFWEASERSGRMQSPAVIVA